MAETARRCAFYARQSRTVTDESASIADQLAALHDVAERRGWVVVGVYADPNAPADALDRRERWLDLLEDAKAGSFDVVAAFDASRLWRSVELKIITTRDLRTAGVKAVATLAGELSTDPDDDPEAGFMGTILAAAAELDNRKRRLLTQRARKREALAGQPHTNGQRPWGYADAGRSALVEDEAQAIGEMARRVLAGEPLHALAADLNRRGMTTTTGRTWTGSLLRQALLSPGLAGMRGHRRDQRGRYEAIYEGREGWEPVLDPALWEQVRDRFTSTTRGPYFRQLLSGLATCARPRDDDPEKLCGAKLTASRDRHGERLYRCKATETNPERCSRLVVVAEALEDEVRDQVLASINPALISRHVAASADADSGAAEAAKVLLELVGRRERIGAALADGLDVAAGQAALRRLDELEHDARSRLRRAQRNDDELLREVAADPAAWWETHPDRRRALLDTVLFEVRVKPAKRAGRTFDPDRVDPRWRA